MKTQGKLFKKIAKKIAAFTSAVLILQPLLMLGVAPAKMYAAPSTSVLISEIQTGESGVGISTNDFVEFYNATSMPFNLNGYRLVKRTQNDSTDTTIKSWTSDTFIPANGFYLWANSGYVGVSADTVTSQTIADNNGVALRQGAEDTGTIVDSVGWGTPNNGFEEGTPFSNIPDDQSIERKSNKTSGLGNALDTDINVNDFDLRTVSEPQNSVSPIEDIINPLKPTVTVPVINIANKTSVPVTITGEANATYNFRITEQGPLGNEIMQTGNMGGTGTASFNVDVSTLADGELIVGASQVDQSGNEGSETNLVVTKDTIAPTFTTIVTPDPANRNDNSVDIEIIASEELQQKKKVSGGSLPVEALETCPECGVTLTIGGKSYPLYDVTSEDLIKDNKYHFTYDISEIANGDPVNFEFKGTDLAGNLGTEVGNFILDNVAPGKVTDLNATAGDNKIELTWKNPVDVDFAGVIIARIGSDGSYWESSALINGTSLIDISVKNGVTYSYDVYALDKSGNRSDKTNVSGTPVAQTITPASVNTVVVEDDTDNSFSDFTETKEEIKAATDEKIDEDDGDKKDTEVKDESKFPKWGLTFLLILAGIGGYLFYVQKPEDSKRKK